METSVELCQSVPTEVSELLYDNQLNENTDTNKNNDTSIGRDLVKLSYDKQHEMYLKGLESSVEQFKQMYPEKYAKAQSIGDDMMNKKYMLNIGEDLKGDLIKCKNILISIFQYGLQKEDLYENELELLKKIMTDIMNIVHDINDIFVNVDDIENIITKITEKLTQLENDY
jgi:hypothetical protein